MAQCFSCGAGVKGRTDGVYYVMCRECRKINEVTESYKLEIIQLKKEIEVLNNRVHYFKTEYEKLLNN